MKLSLRTVTDLTGLEGLEADWQRLFLGQPRAHLGCSYAYVFANAARTRENRNWRCCLLYADDQPAAGLFGRKVQFRRAGISLPVFNVGTEFVGEMLLSQTQPQRALGVLIDQLQESLSDCAFIQFGRLTEPTFAMLCEVLAERKLRYSWNHGSYGYAWDTSSGSQPLYARLGPSTRQLVRRTERKVARDFSVQMATLTSCDSTRNLEQLQRFIAMEASGWKGREGGAIAERPGNAEYFGAIVAAGSAAGLMRWYTLSASGRPIAMHMCMRTHDTVWMPKIAYDEEFSSYSPGLELLRRVLLDCMEDDTINRLDFIGAPKWLDNWRPARQPHFELRLFNPTALGRGVAALDWLRRVARGASKPQATEAQERERRYL